MKNLLLLSFFTFFLIQKSNAQCTATGTSFGNNASIPMYNVAGTVSVVLNTDNTTTLNLGSNFATASGPDVRVFLVDRGTLTNTMLRMPANFLARPKIEMGLINGNGMASFTQAIPAGMNISNFNTIYFYCQQFNQFWDFGSYMPFTAVNCAVLSTEVYDSKSFTIFPNPSNGNFTINFEDAKTIKSYAIYAMNGQQIFLSKQPIIASEKIALSLSSGLYILEILDNENRKIIKKISIKN